ncbi:MAG: CRISPR-associated helicase Cas3' [Anaerovoracaceae bacterium]
MLKISNTGGNMILKDKFPAHFRIIGKKVEMQLVAEHCNQVASLAGFYGARIELEKICELIGKVHDMGKYLDGFRDYFGRIIEAESEGAFVEKSTQKIDHGKHGAAYIWNRYHKGDIYRKITAELIAMVVCYHHGGLEDYLSPELRIKLLERIAETNEGDLEHCKVVERFHAQVCKEEEMDKLFDEAVLEVKNKIALIQKDEHDEHVDLLFSLHLLLKYIYSCLIDADRYDTFLFQSGEERISKDEPKGDTGTLWKRFSEKLLEKEKEFEGKSYSTVLEKGIAEARMDVLKQCREYAKNPTGIYTLTVPTGGGKTFSSLRYAIEHAILHKKQRIVYVLPYTTIIEQNAEEIRTVLKPGEHLLEHHCNVVVEGEEQEVIEGYRLLTEQWSTEIVCTTMVQFLDTFFSTGTQNIRRMHNLTDAILIFDEIQAVPVKCIGLFNETIKFLSHYCNCTAILCTATQPLLNEVEKSICLKGEMIKDIENKFNQFRRVNVINLCREKKFPMMELVDFIEAQYKSEKSILTIMNTKKITRGIFEEMRNRLEKREDNEEKPALYYLSTEMCPAHRKACIKEIKEKLAKQKPVICISTPLIEAGIDISFTCVIRHLAGLDSVAQAAGRGNRHGEGEIKNVYIVELEGENLGNLWQIKKGEIFAREVLSLDDCNHENLLEPEMMGKYFSRYLNDSEIKKMLNYPVDSIRKTLLDMLAQGGNDKAYFDKKGEPFPLKLKYQIKTAAKNFSVIEEDTHSVLVPYEKGTELIHSLTGTLDLKERSKLMREAQKYMVNLYDSELSVLEENKGVHLNDESGIYILEKRFYDEEKGVTLEG